MLSVALPSRPLKERFAVTVGASYGSGITRARKGVECVDDRARERAALAQLSDAEFAQEYPESDLDAIAVTGRPVFRAEDLARQPIKTGIGGPPGLVLYRAPEPGKTYLIGADVAEGIQTSRSVECVESVSPHARARACGKC